jgi:hypothetical protein
MEDKENQSHWEETNQKKFVQSFIHSPDKDSEVYIKGEIFKVEVW